MKRNKIIHRATVTKAGRIIIWYRNDLRVRDHLALRSASEDAGEVIPLYIFDGVHALLAPAQQRVITESLADLRANLRAKGGELFIRTGEPGDVLGKLLHESDAAGVYLTRSHDPERRRSDLALRSAVESTGKMWREFDDTVQFGAGDIVSKGKGKPYTIYTPYRNAWRARIDEIPPPLPLPGRLRSPRVLPGDLRSETGGGNIPTGSNRLRGGEGAALQRMHTFIGDRLPEYGTDRDLLAEDGTSRLSHHLALGTLGVRTLVHAVWKSDTLRRGRSREGSEKYLNELIWREFYYQIMENFPHVVDGSFKKEFDALPWSSSEDRLEAWCNGMTGYPVVDAAMRQLNSEGWMHNRGRMITASFLTRHLGIDWREGERYFMKTLADGDVALNNGGWQWSAGTGNDAQPWFRIFNPTLQGKKFDPNGEYVKRYVPELRAVHDRYIHQPWKMSLRDQSTAGCVIGKDYPSPIVDHDVARKQSLNIYSSIRKK